MLAGVAYVVIGRLFPAPAANVRAWRMAAWIVSLAIFAGQIFYEIRRVRSSARSCALHVATGVAMGAFGLAVAGTIHSLSTSSTIRPVWIISLVAWPAITAVPAFFVALGAAVLLRRFLELKDQS